MHILVKLHKTHIRTNTHTHARTATGLTTSKTRVKLKLYKHTVCTSLIYMPAAASMMAVTMRQSLQVKYLYKARQMLACNVCDHVVHRLAPNCIAT